MPDHYQILDLSPGATREQIKKAYRRKVMECHPDKNASSEAQALFIRVTEAYEALMGLSKERLKNSKPRGYSDASGQTDHYAFYQHVYSQAAEDRRRAAKERVDRQTEKQFEEYKKSNEAFRQSWQYRVFQSVGHAMRMGILLTGLGFLLLAYLTFRIGNALAGYVVSFAFLLIGTAITFLLVRSYWNEYKKSKPDRQ